MTEKKDKDLAAASFFNEVLVPLALEERAKGKSFFPTHADPKAESYFVEPARRAMSRSDFELRALESRTDFISELVALWTEEGHQELAAMAPRLEELAAEMAKHEHEEEADVSDFMYVMF